MIVELVEYQVVCFRGLFSQMTVMCKPMSARVSEGRNRLEVDGNNLGS